MVTGNMTQYQRQWWMLITVLVIVDALAVCASLTLAYALRVNNSILMYGPIIYQESTYLTLTLVSMVFWVVLFAFYGLYRSDNLLGGAQEYQQIAKACTTGIVVLIIVSFLSRDVVVVSRIWLLLSWGFSIAFTMLLRFGVRHAAYALRKRGWFTARVLIIGANDQGVAMAEQWLHNATSGMEVVGFVDDFKPVGTAVVHGLQVIGRPTALAELVRETGANEVVLVPNAVAWETFEELLAQNNKPKDYLLRLSPGFYEVLSTSVAVTNKTFVPLFTINEARIVGIDANLKSLLDYGLGAVLVLLSLPVQLLIAVLLKLEQWDEPVLDRYQTLGNRDEVFNMLKFRMRTSSIGATKASRLCALDSWIYRKGLDKLPQLFNVIAGDMSLVGPRPCVLNQPETDPRRSNNLHSMKPGMFGPWMVGEFWSSAEGRDELYYVRNWTIWLDLQVLVQVAFSWLHLHRAIPVVNMKVTRKDQSSALYRSTLRNTALKSANVAQYSSTTKADQPALRNWTNHNP
jgi:lipopolysaccharide/colanic/teichoic acid biosynthesis glycosyltransferase